MTFTSWHQTPSETRFQFSLSNPAKTETEKCIHPFTCWLHMWLKEYCVARPYLGALDTILPISKTVTNHRVTITLYYSLCKRIIYITVLFNYITSILVVRIVNNIVQTAALTKYFRCSILEDVFCILGQKQSEYISQGNLDEFTLILPNVCYHQTHCKVFVMFSITWS